MKIKLRDTILDQLNIDELHDITKRLSISYKEAVKLSKYGTMMCNHGSEVWVWNSTYDNATRDELLDIYRSINDHYSRI